MIARESKVATVEGSLIGQRVEFTIDDAAKAQIIKSLTDLYSDPILAVVREYSTNARDAAIEAGKADRAIEVSTPTALAPFFKVRDYGVGLTALDMAEVYSKYGSSTKRTTNAQTGMLGYGCKSAMTYTSQFTVVSVKDGARVAVAIGRDERGIPGMTIVEPAAPDSSENYTEVIVPVKRDDTSAFEATAKEFFSVWEPGTVLLNGKAPARFEGMELGEGIWISRRERPAIVMGGVTYPVDQHRMSRHVAEGYNVLAFVPIGEVEFTPAREALNYAEDVTVRTVRKVEAATQRLLPGAIQREIDKAADQAAALETKFAWDEAVRFNSSLRGQSYTFKGAPVPNSIVCPDPPTTGAYGARPSEFTTATNSLHHRGTSTTPSIGGRHMLKAVFIHGFDLQKMTLNHRRKMAIYAEKHQLNPTQWAASKAKVVSEWIPADHIVAWADINAIKLPKAAPAVGGPGSGRIPGSYDCFIDGAWRHGVPANDFDLSDPLFYYTGDYYGALQHLRCLNSHEGTVVVLQERRLAKFQRDLPAAKSLVAEAKAVATAWNAKLTDAQKRKLAIRGSRAESTFVRLASLRDRLDDPQLKEAIAAVAKDSHLEAIEERVRQHDYIGCGPDLSKTGWTTPMERYPLYEGLHYRGVQAKDDLVIYFNAKYAALKAAGNINP